MPNTFTPDQISQILEAFFETVGTRQYIGARYVPIFGRKDEESIEWDNSKPYEPLTIVLYQGNSYTSRQFVPVGVDITNTEFWAITGNYNAQIEQYRRETAAAQADVDAIKEIIPSDSFSESNTVKGYIDAIKGIIPSDSFSASNTVKDYIDNINSTTINELTEQDRLRAIVFDTVEEMKASEELYEGATCHTNGFNSAGDGGAAWYKIVDTAVANEMDIIEINDNMFACLIFSDTVNVKCLGAIDGEDSSGIFNRAVSIANRCIYVPYGNYYIENSIIVNKNISFICDGEISAKANGNCHPAILFDSITYKQIYINHIQYDDTVYNYISNSYQYNIGVVLKNCKNNDVIINKISNCTTGFMLYADSDTGCHYNNISLQTVINCFYGCIYDCSKNTSWINGNTIREMTFLFNSWAESSLYTAYMFMLDSFDSATPYNSNANVFNNLKFEYISSVNTIPVKLIYANYYRMSEFVFSRIESNVTSMQSPFVFENTCSSILVNIVCTINLIKYNDQGKNNIYVFSNEQSANNTYISLNEVDILDDIVLGTGVAFRETGASPKNKFSCAIIDMKNKKIVVRLQLHTTDDIPANTTIVSNITSSVFDYIGPKSHMVIPITIFTGTGSTGVFEKTIAADVTDSWPPTIVTREAISTNRTISIVYDIPLSRLGQ